MATHAIEFFLSSFCYLWEQNHSLSDFDMLVWDKGHGESTYS